MCARTYTVQQVSDHGIPTVRLADIDHGIEVSILPSVGNRACEILVRGQNILYFPFSDPSAAKADRHLNGIPFLAPWANRMPEGFHANGKTYRFNTDSNSIRLDQNGIPIHGLLTSSPFWEVIDLAADAVSAHVTSRLEFWRYPDLAVNWPFAHDYEMTHRLAGGVLEITVAVINRSSDPMPIAVGFHPYFQLPGVPIEEAVAHIPVKRHISADSDSLPTGETTPVSFNGGVSLSERRFDDGFTDLVRTPEGRAVFEDEQALEEQALDRAASRARENASALAKGMDVHLGALIYVSNQISSPTYRRPMLESFAMKERAAPEPPLAIEPHRVSRTATVYAVFAIE